MANKVELQFLTNARQVRGELYQMNAYLHNISDSLDRMNAKAVTGHQKHAGALGNLALRFVGYQLVLNQVMGAQRKLYDYITDGVSKFREFETRLAEVSTIMTDNFEVAIVGMKSGIESLALSFGQNTSDLTKGLYDIMSAAFSAKDAMSLLNQATKASIAGLSDVRTSVDIFTTVLNTYGMSVYEATAVSDALFQSVVRGKFQFAELESALGYVVPIAAQAGIAFDELMAALSTATRHGLHLDMASRGLAMALQNIINPSEGAAKAAKKYGIEMSGLALRVKGIAGIFGEMHDKTKEYGKIVLNELIPNIRSLRVAMVLAGEEGLEGLLDDMDRLSVAAGRTEEALNKIRNTSQFASNIITQQWEKTQREVGQAWDKMALGAQQAITNIVKDWKAFLPIVGPLFSAKIADEARAETEWLYQMQEKYLGQKLAGGQYEAVWDITDKNTRSAVENMKAYLDLQKEMTNMSTNLMQAFRAGDTEEVDKLSGRLNILNTISAELGETFNKVFGEPVLGGIRELENLRLALDELSFDITRLRDELEKPIEYGWERTAEGGVGPKGVIEGTLFYQKELLLSEQELADVRYDIKMGLADETYAYKTLNAEMQYAVKVVREHENAMKADREATYLMNIELRKLQIQALEIQLRGMIRRRGLTRSEEKMLKRIQIEQAKLRLKNIKETKQETKEIHLDYLDKKKMLDDFVRDLENNTYQLKYTYDQQVADLDETIRYEQQILRERSQQWDKVTRDIAALEKRLSRDLEEIIANPDLVSAFDMIGIDINELRDNVKGLISDIDDLTRKTWPGKKAVSPAAGDLTKATVEAMPAPLRETAYAKTALGRVIASQFFQRGTEYVHETGLAMVHRGETIGAAGKEGGGDIIIENVTIEVQQIADIADVEKVAALLSVARNTGMIDKKGRTRFKLR